MTFRPSLTKKGVAVRARQHCAGPLMAHLGLNATCARYLAFSTLLRRSSILINALELAHDLFA
jgi:cysteine desulfurase/selenocysteine lyase